MPKSWSNKDERQYEHIQSSAKKRGRSTTSAKRIAAATVNKKRKSHARRRASWHPSILDRYYRPETLQSDLARRYR